LGDLITPSFTITLITNNLQELTIRLQINSDELFRSEPRLSSTAVPRFLPFTVPDLVQSYFTDEFVLGSPISPGIKRPGHGADHSPPTSVEVKKIWTYTSTPPYAFMA
jgi:hypothetical protein